MFSYQDPILHTRIFRVIELTLSSYRLNFFFKNGIFKNVKLIQKIYMDSEKSINSFKIKKKG